MGAKFDPNADIDPSEFVQELDAEFDPNADIDASQFEASEPDIMSELEEGLDELKNEEEMSALDAAGIGLQSGTSFGLDEIIAGGGAVAGDILGNLSEFQLPGAGDDEMNPLEALRETYYEGKKDRAALKDEAAEDQPAAYYGSTLAGGILGGGGAGLAAKGLASAGKLGQVASKALPSFETAAKGASLGQKAALSAMEGSKAGAIAGFGLGDAKLLEGDVAGTVKDTLEGGLIGGAGGALITGGLGTAGGFIANSPAGKAFSAGYKYGFKGKKLSAENVDADIKGLAKDFYTGIKDSLKKYGLDKNEINDIANEAGVRVHAGEDVQEALVAIMEQKAIGTGAVARDKYVKELMALQGKGKGLQKIEEQLAKRRLKSVLSESGDDLSPSMYDIDTETGLQYGKFSKTSDTGKVSIVSDIVKQDDAFIDDIFDMSLSETEALISELNKYSGMGRKDALIDDTAVINHARKLAVTLRKALDDGIDEVGYKAGDSTSSEVRGKLSSLLSGLDEAGIGRSLRKSSKRDVRAKIDKLRDIFESQSKTSKKQLERVMEDVREGAPELADEFEPKVGLLKELEGIVGGTSADQSVNVRKGLVPSIAEASAGVGNRVGRTVSVPSRAAKAVFKSVAGSKTAKIVTRNANTLLKASPEELQKVAARVSAKGGEAAEGFSNVLTKVAEMPEKGRTAALYGLNQQPGFRSMMKSLNIFDNNEEDE